MSRTLLASNQKLGEKFYTLQTPHDVAEMLDVKYSQLAYHLYVVEPEQRYTTFQIRKKSGHFREISTPITPLKLLQQKLNQVLCYVYPPKPSVHGFVPNKSIVTNARVHVGAKYVLNIDLEDFFPSINFGRVQGMFKAQPYNLPENVASVLAQICCFNNQLPQGAPTSPIISNMICSKMDSRLQYLADDYSSSYTRYADDITFSTRSPKFPPELFLQPEVGHLLTEIILGNGFNINSSKVRLRETNECQEVTGLVIGGKAPKVRRDYIRQIRAMLHACRRYGFDGAEEEFRRHYNKKHRYFEDSSLSFKHVLRGKIEFIGMVRGKTDRIYLKFLNEFRELITMEKHIPPEIRDSLRRFQKEFPDPQKTAFIMMRFSKSKAHEQIADVIKSALEKVGIKGVRADYRQYHTDLYFNILTYLYGCGFGIAVFERIEKEDFNPNVSLEVGYMFGLGKDVCLLKDKNLPTLHSDLVGKLYKTFDPQNISETIPNEVAKWLEDREFHR